MVLVARGWLTAKPGRSNPSELTWTSAVTSFLWRLIKSCTFSSLSGLLSSWWQHLSRLGRNTSLIKQRRADPLTLCRIRGAHIGQRVNPYTLSVTQTFSSLPGGLDICWPLGPQFGERLQFFKNTATCLLWNTHFIQYSFVFNVMWAILHVSFTYVLNNSFS